MQKTTFRLVVVGLIAALICIPLTGFLVANYFRDRDAIPNLGNNLVNGAYFMTIESARAVAKFEIVDAPFQAELATIRHNHAEDFDAYNGPRNEFQFARDNFVSMSWDMFTDGGGGPLPNAPTNMTQLWSAVELHIALTQAGLAFQGNHNYTNANAVLATLRQEQVLDNPMTYNAILADGPYFFDNGYVQLPTGRWIRITTVGNTHRFDMQMNISGTLEDATTSFSINNGRVTTTITIDLVGDATATLSNINLVLDRNATIRRLEAPELTWTTPTTFRWAQTFNPNTYTAIYRAAPGSNNFEFLMIMPFDISIQFDVIQGWAGIVDNPIPGDATIGSEWRFATRELPRATQVMMDQRVVEHANGRTILFPSRMTAPITFTVTA